MKFTKDGHVASFPRPYNHCVHDRPLSLCAECAPAAEQKMREGHKPGPEGIAPPPRKSVLGPDPSLDEEPLWNRSSAGRLLDSERARASAEKAYEKTRMRDRREKIATAVLASLTGDPVVGGAQGNATAACEWADALIAELDK